MLTALIAATAMAEQGRTDQIDKYMTTRWSEDAIEGRAWTEYPRPQLVRDEWLNLNGMWEYAIAPKDSKQFPGNQGEIRVPYPIQSFLSGVRKQVYADQSLWYRRTFEVPAG